MRFSLLLVPALALAQTKPAPPKPVSTQPMAQATSLQAMEKEIADLKKEIASLRAEIKKHDVWFEGRDFMAQLYQKKVDAIIKESVTLDPAENGYGIITIDSGTFFISLDKVETDSCIAVDGAANFIAADPSHLRKILRKICCAHRRIHVSCQWTCRVNS